MARRAKGTRPVEGVGRPDRIVETFREFPSAEILPPGVTCVDCGAGLHDAPTAIVIVTRSPRGGPFFYYHCPECGARAKVGLEPEAAR